jgi:GNAT superfamily N-acetyltransferase
MIELAKKQALHIDRAAGPADIEDARTLFGEYERALAFPLAFQGFAHEVATLPGDYAPPAGRLLLARWQGALAGCVALHQFGDGVGEMKRLYVRDDFRGHGIGRALATRVIDEARAIGYRAVRLDTLARMHEAVALYRTLGFVDIAPYRHNPMPDTIYLELALERILLRRKLKPLRESSGCE